MNRIFLYATQPMPHVLRVVVAGDRVDPIPAQLLLDRHQLILIAVLVSH